MLPSLAAPVLTTRCRGDPHSSHSVFLRSGNHIPLSTIRVITRVCPGCKILWYVSALVTFPSCTRIVVADAHSSGIVVLLLYMK